MGMIGEMSYLPNVLRAVAVTSSLDDIMDSAALVLNGPAIFLKALPQSASSEGGN